MPASNASATMPTILVLLGWRFFFYANEGDEPIHVHCRKGGVECKYWLDVDNFDIQEAYSYEMSARDKKQVRQIIFQHFDYITDQWRDFQERRQR
jgi:formylmethanofuran dehydrogenase subunit A